MLIIEPTFEIVHTKSAIEMYKSIEEASRNCYRSGNKITDNSYEEFIRNAIKKGHHSVLEHENISVLITTDKGLLAEITRHRLCSYSVESSRYVNYEDPDTFKVIKPSKIIFNTKAYFTWNAHMRFCEGSYNNLIKEGCNPEEARSVLPQCFATTIRMTANIREWRHILQLRTSKGAHPDMILLMSSILEKFKKEYTIFFEDIGN
jgi:thymidylate synthase (FAD)